MKVVELKQPKPADNVAATLRRIADELDAGNPDWPVSTALVVLAGAGSESRPDEKNISWTGYEIRVHGLGPRADPFTVRGVMMAAFDEL